MAKPIIELKGITKIFGTGSTAVTALKDVDLTIYEGEIFGGSSASPGRARAPWCAASTCWRSLRRAR